RQRQRLTIILRRNLEVVAEGCERPLVAWKTGLNARQGCTYILTFKNAIADELREVILLAIHGKTELEMPGIHLSDVEIGYVPHQANCESHIESRRTLRLLCSGQPVFPSGGIVVFGI